MQDPFVLNHNTTSNVSERSRSDIVREFLLADDHCRYLIGCSESINTEHSGIVKLLSGSTSSVGSPALSPAIENKASGSEDTARIQLFVLKFLNSSTPAAAVPGPSVAELEHGAIGSVRADSQYDDAVDTVKLMLADIFDMDCTPRDQPSEQFDFQLSQLLIEKSDRDFSRLVQSQQCNLPVESPSNSAGPCVADDNQLPSDRKHLQSEDSGNSDEDSDTSDNDSSRQHAGRSPAKRHKSIANTSDDSKQPSAANSGRRILLSVDCSARSRLWVGRKKVHRQCMHFSSELQKQLEVSSVLKNQLTKTDDTILDFELAIVRPPYRSDNELLFAVLPSKKTSREFGCFITFFMSLIQKLVKKIAIEGPHYLRNTVQATA